MFNFYRTVVALMAVTILGIAAQPVYAMHISEGILPMGWALLWFLASLPFVVQGLINLRLRSEKESHFKALVGLVAQGFS